MLFKAVCLARWRAIAASEPFNAEMRRTELHGRLPSSETARTKVSIVSSDPDWTSRNSQSANRARLRILTSSAPPRLTDQRACWHHGLVVSVSIQVDLPEALAEKARAEGLLQPPRLAALLEEEVERARLARETTAMLDAIRSQPGEPMSLEEIQKVVDEVRAERARGEAGR